MNWRLREIRIKVADWVCTAIAWRIPKRLAEWVFIRVWAHATTGRYGSEDATAIRAVDCLQRFGKPNDAERIA